MTFDHIVSLVSAFISFAALIFLARQVRDGTKQRQAQSLVEIYDINRQLLTLAFDHPKLFAVLDDKETDAVWERRYLQMWLNQFSLIHTYLSQSVIKGELKESLILDLSDFMSKKNMQRHWKTEGAFYPKSFQKLVNGLIAKHEPPAKAAHAHPHSGG